MNIVIYTKENCPNCESAKTLLETQGLPYTAFNLDEPAKLAAFCETYPGVRQMPQIFINDQRVGGIDGLRAALKLLGL